MDFTFYMPTRVISGENCIKQNSAIFSDFGKKALIVTGTTSAVKSGAFNDIVSVLKQEGIDYILYNCIEPNPLLSTCFNGAKMALDNGVEFIVGIGGGSALDAAKAISIFAGNPDLKEDDIFLRTFRNKSLPLVLVGTTAGTGSEVSAVSVLTQDKTMNKKSVVHPYCYAQVSFADPRYTYTMNYNTTVSTALDAFSHTTEGWFSPNCSDVIKLFAKKAFVMIWDALQYLYNNECLPDEETRNKLFYGSLYAGVVLNHTGTAYPHPMGYVLSEDFNIPHGKACCAFLPSLIRRAEITEPGKFKEFSDILSEDADTICKVITKLAGIESIRMSKENISKYSDRWIGLKNYLNTPGGFNENLANRLMENLFLKGDV